MSKSYQLLMNFIDNFFNIDCFTDISYNTIKIKELFKKRFWKNKKRIKYFFKEIDILLKEEYDLYTKKEWNGFIHKLRLYLEKKKIEDMSIRVFLFKKLRVFEKTCYENSYPENLTEKFCPDIKTCKSITCNKCRSERFMYILHSIEGNSTCKRCNKKLVVFYEKCC